MRQASLAQPSATPPKAGPQGTPVFSVASSSPTELPLWSPSSLSPAVPLPGRVYLPGSPWKMPLFQAFPPRPTSGSPPTTLLTAHAQAPSEPGYWLDLSRALILGFCPDFSSHYPAPSRCRDPIKDIGEHLQCAVASTRWQHSTAEATGGGEGTQLMISANRLCPLGSLLLSPWALES